MSAFPTSPAPATATLSSVQPTRVTTSHSLKRNARTRGAQRWLINLNWGMLTRAELMPIFAFVMSLRGQADTCTLTLVGHTAPLGSWLGSPVVNGAGQTGRTINLRGFTASQTNVIKAGDILKFSGHTKVYMATADASSDGSGNCALTMEPAPIAALADGEVITVNDVPFTLALASDNLDIGFKTGIVYDTVVSLVEHV